MIKVAITGTGNVAYHLAHAISQADGLELVAVKGRNIDAAKALAESCECCAKGYTTCDCLPETDINIIAVSDTAIAEVAAEAEDDGSIWVHTSGSTPADVLAPYKRNYGVMYPLNTFTRSVDLELKSTPIFFEGATAEVAAKIRQVAEKISDVVMEADSARRKVMHLAAVFACNFANELWIDADEIMRSADMDIQLLMPLINTTLRKIKHTSPENALTGPARRGDMGILHTQIDQLDGDKRLIYHTLTNAILHRFHKDNELKLGK